MTNDIEVRVRRVNPIVSDEELDGVYGSEWSSDLLREIRDKKDGVITAAPPLRYSPYRRAVIAVAAAVFVLLAIGGIAFIVGTTEPPVATTPSTVPPDQLPESAPSVTWNDLDANPEDLPFASSGAVSTEAGFVRLDQAGLWRSTDGMEWTRENPPVEATLMSLFDLESWGYWLVSVEGDVSHRLFHSEDTMSWEEADVGQMPIPELSGVVWSVSPGSIVSTDDYLVHTFRLHGEVIEPLHEELGVRPEDVLTAWDPETRTVEIWDFTGSCDPCPVLGSFALTMTIEDDGIRVTAIDTLTGQAVRSWDGAAPGIDPDQLLAGLATGEVVVDTIATSADGQGFEWQPTPWDAPYPYWANHTEVVAANDRFLAYTVRGRADNPLNPNLSAEVWESVDAQSWSSLGDPSLPAGSIGSTFSVYRTDQGLLATVSVNTTEVGELPEAEIESEVLLRSRDGLDWSEVELEPTPSPPSIGRVHRVEAGWLYTRLVYGPDYRSTGQESLEVWFSANGDVWNSIEVPHDITTPEEGGRFDVWAAGDRLFVALDGGAAGHVWIARFDTS
jgi:hypothetical protein